MSGRPYFVPQFNEPTMTLDTWTPTLAPGQHDFCHFFPQGQRTWWMEILDEKTDQTISPDIVEVRIRGDGGNPPNIWLQEPIPKKIPVGGIHVIQCLVVIRAGCLPRSFHLRLWGQP